MKPKTCFPSFRTLRVDRTAVGVGIALLSLLWLAGCAKPLVLDATLPQQFAEISCVEQCRTAKESCNADARYDYRQCQAGYDQSFRDYRWCLASAWNSSDCGYPWWPCAENLYGYCANRYNDCKHACEGQGHR
ncbi:hypothetical protein [Thiocystis violacea]|uniref:hypothetical protein n=1 Tax=Thiocystis violacea TaxID=13725 RepID=UPI0019064D5C|nr:hypothetical protein [Thiocystis violacea]MBK1720903.1 hypothetical protein [Thiocystis violacea]